MHKKFEPVPETRELCDAVNRHERRAVKARKRKRARAEARRVRKNAD